MHHTIRLQGGAPLVLRTFEPAGAPLAVIVLPSAMGVTQSYYSRFAEWLAARGYLAATFDYRGIGQSAPATLRGFEVDIRDWATQDCAAVIDFMKAQAPTVPLYWVGHSLGGQLLGLIPNRERIDRAITIATGNGYWRENSWQTRRFVWWLWFVVAPLALRVVGYFPGRRLRKVGDLPRGVMAQWRRWCLNREYSVGAEGEAVRAQYASVRTPIVSLSFADDEMMSLANTESIHGFYSSAPRKMTRIAPRDVGEPRIGHFGFFRPRFERALWRPFLLPELA